MCTIKQVYEAKTLPGIMMTESSSGWKWNMYVKERQNKLLLKMHTQAEHMGLTQTCEMCGQGYKTEDTLRQHLRDGACKVRSVL